MDHAPDPADQHDDPTRLATPASADAARFVDEPPRTGVPRGRAALVGVVTVLALAVVGVGAVLAQQAGDSSTGEQTTGAVIETGTSTAGSVAEAALTSSSTTGSSADAAPVTTLPAVPPAGQTTQPAAADEPEPQEPDTGAPTIPAGHVDSCAYPNMPPTVVSGTTYTAAPTPTVTAVTSPDRCPPYSAGYPWDGS